MSFAHSSSVKTATPNFFAAASLEPAPGRATTWSVFFDTERDLGAERSAGALPRRGHLLEVPVNTTVLPAMGDRPSASRRPGRAPRRQAIDPAVMGLGEIGCGGSRSPCADLVEGSSSS